jgi:hypothetical protein
VAAPAVRAVGNPVEINDTTVLAGISPGAVQVGDLVIVLVQTYSNAAITPTHTLQAGFTEIFSVTIIDSSNRFVLSAAYKIATVAGAQNYQPYQGGGSAANDSLVGFLVISSGTFDPASPLAGTPTTASSTTSGPPDSPAMTTTVAEALVAAVGAWYYAGADTTTTVTNPAGYTARLSVPGAEPAELAVATLEKAVAGAEDPAAWADNTSPSCTAAATFAISPPVAALGGPGLVSNMGGWS